MHVYEILDNIRIKNHLAVNYTTFSHQQIE